MLSVELNENDFSLSNLRRNWMRIHVSYRWPMWRNTLAWSTSSWNGSAACNTKRESLHTFWKAYLVYVLSFHTPLLDFFDAHSHHFRDIVLSCFKVHKGEAEDQLRICTRTINIVVAIERNWRNRKGKRLAEKRSQIRLITSGQGVLDRCFSTHYQIAIISTWHTAWWARVRITRNLERVDSTDIIPSRYFSRTSPTGDMEARNSRVYLP